MHKGNVDNSDAGGTVGLLTRWSVLALGGTVVVTRESEVVIGDERKKNLA